tara:strand:- start:3830 stop:4459 length:630 start_codon:yes stop_codon:yes gene_type:complete
MIELKLASTKEDGSKVYEAIQLTIKAVSQKGGSYGFVFDEMSTGEATDWWNAGSYAVKGSPEIPRVESGDRVLVELTHAPQIDKDGQHNGNFWRNVTKLSIIEGTASAATDEVKTPHATPTTTAKIDSFPKSLDYNVDRDNKIIMQVVLKAQIDLVNSLLSANSDVSGILEGYDSILEANISKATNMIDEIWTKRTNISDWEISENSEN